MQQRRWLVGTIGMALGAWSGSMPLAAQELSCPQFWVPPGSREPQCLEIFRSEPPATNNSTGSTGSSAPAGDLPAPPEVPPAAVTPTRDLPTPLEAPPADGTSDSSEEAAEEAPVDWTPISRRPDGLQLLLDEASVTAGDRPEARTFTYRQDASNVNNRLTYNFTDKIQTTTVDCELNTFNHGETALTGLDGQVREFESDTNGVVTEEADPDFLAVLQAACQLDLAARKEASETARE